jgi:DNA polymerase-4
VADLRAQTPAALSQLVGRWGETLWRQAHGEDDRPVVTEREPRSRGAETTLERDTRALEILGPLLVEQAGEVADALTRNARRARTVTVKVRFSDFVTRTRARSLPEPVSEAALLAGVGEVLLREVLDSDPRAVRLIGLQASQLVDPSSDRQLTFDFA